MPTRQEQTSIPIARHIRDRLVCYKSRTDLNWDEFFLILIKLLEKELGESK